jgi:uncharacterized protein with FMN-binding domain
MKRAPLLVLAGTVAGFIGVLGFHSRQVSATPAGASGAQAGGSPSAGSPAAAKPASASASPASASAGPAAGNGAVRSAVGPEVQFGYGVLDVRVTVSGTRITDLSVPVLQTAEPTSQQISEQAIPMLRTEVLSAQSLNVNAISGATYTSDAYAQSLQAALDKLHVK